MELLIATHNKAKLKLYTKLLSKYNLDILCLDDLNITHEVEEDGNDSTQNAIKKADEYYKLTNIKTISVDDGLELDNVPDGIQPGTHVRRVNGNERASDEEMISYYTDIVKTYGDNGRLNARWKKSIAISDEKGIRHCEFGNEIILTDKPLDHYNEGYPMDSLTINPLFNKYTIELNDEEKKQYSQQKNEELNNFFETEFKY